MKLPKLHLLKFGDCPSGFRTFWDSFHSEVGPNTDINDVEKMNYLKGLLDCPAAATIAGLANIIYNITQLQLNCCMSVLATASWGSIHTWSPY